MNNLFKFRMKAFALIALLLVSVSNAFAQQEIAIIDAGSSGSRLYVYKISKDGKSIKTLCNEKKNLPLSKVVAHKDSVIAYMESITSLFQPEKYNIPLKKNSIPLYVLATAGMRMVDSVKAKSIYLYMKSYKSENIFKVKDAMTISGQYEGLYAWIALNYENGNLGLSNSTPEKPLTYTSSSTFGIIEIGGASMQIAFAAQSSVSYDKKDLIDRKGFSRIYCKSYLGGGVDRIFKCFGSSDSNRQYSDSIKNLPKLKGMKLYGLGKPIKTVKDNLCNKTFEEYVAELPADTEKNFHPKSNAYYIQFLADSLGIKVKNINIPQNDISWTKGAVIDIVINQKDPEPFNYDPINPN